MSITFADIPANLRVPFVAVEIDATLANQGPSLINYEALLIGQSLASGTALDDTLHKVTSAEAVALLAGRGSILHRMAIAWYASNAFTSLTIAVVGDGGSQATGTLTVIGVATADSSFAVYCGGVRVPVSVNDTDDQDAIAAAIAAAINLDTNLAITAAAVLGVVTATFNNGGLVGNEYDLRVNFLEGEELGAGITSITVAAMAGGATAPSLTAIIAALGDTWYQVWAHPYNDAVSLTAIENELSRRFGPLVMVDGVAITSAALSHSALITLGDGRNSQHSEIIAQPGDNTLTPPMEFAAETAAIVAKEAANDPARPFQTLAMRNAISPAEADLFTLSERNLLLFDGIATSKSAAGGVTRLDRLITTYQTAPGGGADTAFLDVTTMLTLLFLRFNFRNRMQKIIAQYIGNTS